MQRLEALFHMGDCDSLAFIHLRLPQATKYAQFARTEKRPATIACFCLSGGQ